MSPEQKSPRAKGLRYSAGLLRSTIVGNGAELREHPALLVLYLLSFATPLLLWPSPPRAATIGGWVGAIALGLLIARVVLVGFTGYERFIGLRMIRRPGPSHGLGSSAPIWKRGRFWLVVFWSTAALGFAALLAFNHFVDREDSALLELLSPLRLSLVFYVALASFAGLAVVVGQRFTVFGTTSIIGVALGVAALLVIQSVSSGFQHEFERRVVGVYAHVNVTQSFGAYGMVEHRRFEAWLRTLDGVEGASPFVYHAMALAPHRVAQANSDIMPASVLVKGIEPLSAAQVIDLPEHLELGSGRAIPLTDLRSDYPLMPVPDRADHELPAVIAETPDPRGANWYAGAIAAWSASDHDDLFRGGAGHVRVGRAHRQSDEVWEDPPDRLDPAAILDDLDRSAMPTMFIGVVLARELQLAEGDVVRLVDPGASFDASEPPKFVHYVIAGVFQAGFAEYDARLVYVDIKELQRFKYRGKDIVSGVDLRLRDPNSAPEIGALIREALNGSADGPLDHPELERYSVLEWQKLNESLFSSIRMQRNIVTVVLSLVIFVAGFNVLSALWTMVVRRTAEIAIVMSMGATGPQVGRIFQAAGMAIGLVGSLGGIVLGLVVCWLVEIYGYTLDPEVYVIAELPVEIDLARIAWIFALALAMCFIATMPPSLRAAQLRPVDGLKYE